MGMEEQTLLFLSLGKSDYRWSLDLEEEGHGSPSVWKNRVFLNTATDKGKTGRSFASCQTGKLEWSRSYPSRNHKTHRFNSFASSTPAVDADRVYSVWGIPVN